MAESDRETVGLHAQLACVWEATARKPGNVHRYADFDDLTYLDFVTAAAAVAPVLGRSPDRRVGRTVLDGVRATRRVVSTNANLGILLLLAPLTKAAAEADFHSGLDRVLDELDVEDARTGLRGDPPGESRRHGTAPRNRTFGRRRRCRCGK